MIKLILEENLIHQIYISRNFIKAFAANGVVLNPQPITRLPNENTIAKDLANRAYLSLQARFAS